MAQKARLLLQSTAGTFPQFEFMETTAESTYRLENSSWNTTDMGDGLALETFILWFSDTPNAIAANIIRLESLLNLAHELYLSGSPHDSVQLYTRVQDELSVRGATVIGGSITPLPGGVVTRDLKRNSARFAVTIDRYALWEYDTPSSVRNASLLSIGGTWMLPNRMGIGVQAGRIKTTTITGVNNSRIKEFWVGIKPAFTSLSDFDPEIVIESTRDAINLKPLIARWFIDASFIGGEGIIVDWNDGETTEWNPVYRIWLKDFNSDTQTGGHARLNKYIGRYHLIMRYKTGSDGSKFGLQGAYGWGNDSTATKLDPVYVESTDSDFRFINLGIINIGGPSFARENLTRLFVSDFGISIHAHVTQIEGATDEEGDFDNYVPPIAPLYLDNLFLVPADHYMHVEVETQFSGAGRRGEIYINETGAAYGLVVGRDDNDRIYDSSPTNRKVFEAIENLDAETWAMPTQPGSVLVIVADSEGNSLRTTAKVKMEVEVASRTAGL